MIVAVESAAAAITRLYHAMSRQGEEKFKVARENLADWIRFVVKEPWPALRRLRFEPGNTEFAGRDALDRVLNALEDAENEPGDLNLSELFDRLKVSGCTD